MRELDLALRIFSKMSELEGVESEVCVVKNAVDAVMCDRLAAALIRWRDAQQPNEGRGTNWWYKITNDGSDFQSFMFRRLLEIEPASFRDDLVTIYRTLFDAHCRCGTIPFGLDFTDLLEDRGELPSLDPLIFFYAPGAGMFRRHAHVHAFQRTQTLINVTKRNRDYVGGETLIEEDDGNVVSLGECFDQGDLFSFRYDLFHSVKPVLRGTPEGIGRISVLMPFHPRGDYAIRY